MTEWNEHRLLRMHRGCSAYLLTGLLLIAAILSVTLAVGLVIAGALAGAGA